MKLIYTILFLFIILNFFSFDKKKQIKKKIQNVQKVQYVPPQFIYGVLNDQIQNVILVNVLSDKMKFKISLNGKNDLRSLSKLEFENLLLNNNNQIPNNIDKVIIYCAGWSCNGAKNYYQELINKQVNVEKVVDYVGAIHEWATYAGINKNVFTFTSTENNLVLSSDEVNEIRKYTAHEYFIDNVITDNYIKKISIQGKDIKYFL